MKISRKSLERLQPLPQKCSFIALIKDNESAQCNSALSDAVLYSKGDNFIVYYLLHITIGA
jgi:hypothetical protein